MAKLTIYHAFILITVAYILIMSIFPMIYMVYGSLTNWRLGLVEMNFIGTRYYSDLVDDYRFYNSLAKTAYITAIAVPIEMLLGLALANLMRAKIKFKRLFRTIFLMPLFCAPVAVALMGEIIFYESGGPVNGILNLLGFANFPWRSSPNIAPFTVAMCDIWMWTPFCFLITLAGLEGIPREFNEAAVVDGASSWQIFRKINLPMLSAPLVTILMFRIIDSIKIFDIPFILVGGGGPGISTEVMTIYIYKVAFRNFNLASAAAISIVFLVVIIIVANVFLGRLRKHYE